MPIEIKEYHDEVVDEMIRVLQKYPWKFVSGRGTQGDMKFLLNNKMEIRGKKYVYKIALRDDQNIEILVHHSNTGLLYLRLLIERQTGKLEGWDWDEQCRCQATANHQYEMTAYNDWPQAIRRYANRTVGIAEAANPSSIYQKPEDSETTIKPYDITRDVPDAKKPDKPAIAIFACDRPNYFEETVDALVQNEEFQLWDVYVFLDKATCGDPEASRLMQEQDDYIRYRAPHVITIQRETNWGCGRNLIDGRRQLFDNLGYERVYVFEDDMVVTPHYIKFCEDVWRWTESKGYADIGTVQGFSQCRIKEDTRIRFYDHALNATLDTLWGYSISLKAWDFIRDDLYKYEDKYLNCEYEKRDHAAIEAWIKRTYETFGRRDNSPQYYPDTYEFLNTARNYFQSAPTGQDGITNVLLYIRAFTRLAPVVSRAKYIGKEGLNFDEDKYRKGGYGSLTWKDCDVPAEKRYDFLEMFDAEPDVTQITSLADLSV